MVRSLVLVGGFAVLVVLLGASRQLLLPSGSNAKSIRVVSYADEVAAARRLAPRAVVAPEGLPSRWRPTSATLDRHGAALDLHIGFVTPADQYAGLEETTGDAGAFVRDRLGTGSEALSPVSIGGVTWQERRTAKGELALVRRSGSATVIVSGSARVDELSALARSLR